jgi:hypothetical protein
MFWGLVDELDNVIEKAHQPSWKREKSTPGTSRL